MKTRSLLAPAAALALAFSLTACASEMTTEEAAEQYLAIICPSNIASDDMESAFDDGDSGAFRDLAGMRSEVTATTAKELRDSSWPDAVDPEHIEDAASYYEDVSEALQLVAEAQTMAEMMVIPPSEAKVEVATAEIRHALELPPASPEGCKGYAVEAQEMDEVPGPTPTPEADDGTVQQWASVVAGEKSKWDDWALGWDGICDSSIANSAEGLLCRGRLASAALTALKSVTTLEDPMNSESPAYIAEEPNSEISGIYSDLIDVTKAVSDAGEAWVAQDCMVEVQEACDTLGLDLQVAAYTLRDGLDSWIPYL